MNVEELDAAVLVARKEYIKRLKFTSPNRCDEAPSDLMLQLNTTHAEWHRLLNIKNEINNNQ